jgi:hypothetical protein
VSLVWVLRAQTVVMAVAYNGRQLLLTAVFVIILVYLYSIVALLSFRDAYGKDSSVRTELPVSVHAACPIDVDASCVVCCVLCVVCCVLCVVCCVLCVVCCVLCARRSSRASRCTSASSS